MLTSKKKPIKKFIDVIHIPENTFLGLSIGNMSRNVRWTPIIRKCTHA